MERHTVYTYISSLCAGTSTGWYPLPLPLFFWFRLPLPLPPFFPSGFGSASAGGVDVASSGAAVNMPASPNPPVEALREEVAGGLAALEGGGGKSLDDTVALVSNFVPPAP